MSTTKERVTRERRSARWAMENKHGITCYVYSPLCPNHLAAEYRDIRPAGYYCHRRNIIVDDEVTTIYDGRAAPGS